MWALMGVCGDMIDFMARPQARWKGDCLCMASSFQIDNGVLRHVRSAYMTVLRINALSTSRWRGVSDTSRSLARACLMGLESLADCPARCGRILLDMVRATQLACQRYDCHHSDLLWCY